MATTRELYEDWKPLLEAQQDALVREDIELELQDLYVEQCNNSPGVSAGGPMDPGYQAFPLLKKHNPRVADLVDQENDDRTGSY